jgi:diadenosine tetraphosphatase ApaH/serine/threonine PP2A family protein phosphatase
LTPENREFLVTLPRGPLQVNSFEFFHGAVRDEDEYLLDFASVEAVRSELTYGVAFFGHTHVQGGFVLHRRGIRCIDREVLEIEPTAAYLINPGSVGQPRDQDRRAAYAIYDDAERIVSFGRVEYDINLTYRKIVEAGLPEVHGRRLFRGT